MARLSDEQSTLAPQWPSSQRQTAPFHCQGEQQVVTNGGTVRSLRRCRWPSGEVVEEIIGPESGVGCYVFDLAASISGRWIVTQRNSGQGNWGYDVLQSCPLVRQAGIVQERGYMLEVPRFSPDETYLVGGAGRGFMGGWWTHPEDDIDEPPRPGPKTLGFVFVHRLPGHEVTRHELRIDLPPGWVPDDPWDEWYGPRDITPTSDGVRFMLWWGVPVEVKLPLPTVIALPVPHPSGQGLL